MPQPLLTLFKYLFLVVLYLFFIRVLRAVWIELREPKVAAGSPVTPSMPYAAGTAAASPTAMTTAVPAQAAAGPPSGSPGPLLILRGPGGATRASWPLGNEVTVGRSPGCAIALPDDTFVSQIHTRVYRRDGTVWVEDLGSTNGTFVNDQRLSVPTPLAPGDRLRVGQTVLELSG